MPPIRVSLTRPVDPPREGVAPFADAAHGGQQRHDADRDVDQEDRPPGDSVGQRATDERADRKRGADRHPVCRERLRALRGLGRHLRDQRQRASEQDRGARTLDRPRRDQHPDPASGAGRGRGGREHAETDQEQAPAAEPVGDCARGQNGRGERQRYASSTHSRPPRPVWSPRAMLDRAVLITLMSSIS